MYARIRLRDHKKLSARPGRGVELALADASSRVFETHTRKAHVHDHGPHRGGRQALPLAVGGLSEVIHAAQNVVSAATIQVGEHFGEPDVSDAGSHARHQWVKSARPQQGASHESAVARAAERSQVAPQGVILARHEVPPADAVPTGRNVRVRDVETRVHDPDRDERAGSTDQNAARPPEAPQPIAAERWYGLRVRGKDDGVRLDGQHEIRPQHRVEVTVGELAGVRAHVRVPPFHRHAEPFQDAPVAIVGVPSHQGDEYGRDCPARARADQVRKTRRDLLVRPGIAERGDLRQLLDRP